jgi:hypothetical protein
MGRRSGSTGNVVKPAHFRIIALASTKFLMLQMSNEQELERIKKE